MFELLDKYQVLFGTTNILLVYLSRNRNTKRKYENQAEDT